MGKPGIEDNALRLFFKIPLVDIGDADLLAPVVGVVQQRRAGTDDGAAHRGDEYPVDAEDVRVVVADPAQIVQIDLGFHHGHIVGRGHPEGLFLIKHGVQILPGGHRVVADGVAGPFPERRGHADDLQLRRGVWYFTKHRKTSSFFLLSQKA